MNDVPAMEAELGLPEIWPLEPIGDSFNVYGIAELARDYCGLPYVPRLIPGFWCHGWRGDYYHIHPEVICPHAPEEKLRRKWFSRESEAIYLRRHGYLNTKAIGHPIIYVPRPEVARRPGSLLVMPTKGFTGIRRDEGCHYAEAIAEIKHLFKEIVVCISPRSYEDGDWMEGFENQGFRMIRGASTRDRNGFVRQAKMFSQFEYVTTNSMGSQIPYAAYFGAKVSVWGPEPVIPPPEKPVRLFKAVPHLKGELFHKMSNAALFEAEPWLDVAPQDGVAAREWAEGQLGELNKLSPEALAREFLWTPEGMREFNQEIEAQLHSQKILEMDISRLKQRETELSAEGEAETTKFTEELLKRAATLKKRNVELKRLRTMASSKAWKLIARLFYRREAPSP